MSMPRGRRGASGSISKGAIPHYAATVFSMAAFTRPLPCPMFLVPPSIDPLSDKNCALPEAERLETLAALGIDPERPLLVQVSRFDRFKDPLGVIEAYRLLKPYYPELQLALAGGTADDDPEGAEVLREVMEQAGEDNDIKVLLLPPDAHRVINALQRSAIVVLQKSHKGGLRSDGDRGAVEEQAGDRRRLRRHHDSGARLPDRLPRPLTGRCGVSHPLPAALRRETAADGRAPATTSCASTSCSPGSCATTSRCCLRVGQRSSAPAA